MGSGGSSTARTEQSDMLPERMHPAQLQFLLGVCYDADAFPAEVTVSAYAPVTGEQSWQTVLHAQTSIGASGNMVTAGNLLFQGVEDGGFYALDASTGEELFRYAAPRPVRASPMSYEINGKQFVTVVATNTVLTLALP